MKLLQFIYPALLALLFTPDTALAAKAPKNAILLSNVKTLTLRANSKTTGRRSDPIQQLTCTGPACKHYKLEILRCTNSGSDYDAEAIQWSCTASIPEEFKLGGTDVQCEGYANRDDEYVLKGSCGVTYRLLYTSLGEEKYGKSWGGGSNKESMGWSSVLFIVIFLAVAAWILYAIWIAAGGQAPAAAGRPGGGWGGGWGGGGGGGGGGDWNDPPPPYPGKRYGSAGGNEGWRPGFWSGTAAGAAAGYMAGNRGNRQQQQSNNSWFGGGNSGSGFGQAGPSRSSSSSSGARHESTGFGSTSRR